MAAFNLPPGPKSRPKTAFREVGPARLFKQSKTNDVEPPEEAVDDGPWDRVFVGVHYAEWLSRLFQYGLTRLSVQRIIDVMGSHLSAMVVEVGGTALRHRCCGRSKNIFNLVQLAKSFKAKRPPM
jgi:hypothetical protein